MSDLDASASGKIPWTFGGPAIGQTVQYPTATGVTTSTQSSSMFHGVDKPGLVLHSVTFTGNAGGDTVTLFDHDGNQIMVLEPDTGDSDEINLGLRLRNGISAQYSNATSTTMGVTIYFTPLLQASSKVARSSRYPISTRGLDE